ncbi:hypothetical protein NH340_JMT07618 [Sarcoptes scabiei]|nr:hypothetical protein NH340_JMT07618 [Sarcoptes scabiei]
MRCYLQTDPLTIVVNLWSTTLMANASGIEEIRTKIFLEYCKLLMIIFNFRFDSSKNLISLQILIIIHNSFMIFFYGKKSSRIVCLLFFVGFTFIQINSDRNRQEKEQKFKIESIISILDNKIK